VAESCKVSLQPALLGIMNDFSFYTHGIPNVAGALDGCFIPMFKATGPFGFRYWCYKNYCSINDLADCDARGVFTWIDVGRPGCFGDAATFNFSSLLNQLELVEELWSSRAAEF
jgi:hypothetical protein